MEIFSKLFGRDEPQTVPAPVLIPAPAVQLREELLDAKSVLERLVAAELQKHNAQQSVVDELQRSIDCTEDKTEYASLYGELLYEQKQLATALHNLRSAQGKLDRYVSEEQRQQRLAEHESQKRSLQILVSQLKESMERHQSNVRLEQGLADEDGRRLGQALRKLATFL